MSEQMKRKQMKAKNGNYGNSNSGLWTPPKGTDKFLISTGSTLVDLAITGRRFKGGGIPMGILVEIFGASSKGKTVLLLEMAGNVQRRKGDYLFLDPEARVGKEFAKIFGFFIEEDKYEKPNSIEQAFSLIKQWKPKGKGPFVVFIDSIAALVSSEEAEEKGDEYSGARRAKEFSQQLRQIARLIEQREYLIVCTNQVRQIMGAPAFGKKTKATGGEAPSFYSSLRFELKSPAKDGIVKLEKTIKGIKHKRNIGVQTDVFIEKSTVAAPYQTGKLRILFDFGVDDVVPNLQFLKTNTKSSTYVLDNRSIGKSLNDAVVYIENNNLEQELKEEVTKLWLEIQKEMTPNRKPKVR